MSKFITKLKHQILFTSHCRCPRPTFLPSTFRLSTFGLLLTFNLSFLIFNCGFDVEDPTPPSPPVWVQKSLPEEWPERGIDAHELGGISLEWELSTEESVVACNIFRAELIVDDGSFGPFEKIATVGVTNASNYNYNDRNTIVSTIYAYRIAAEDYSGNLSNYSDTIQYSRHEPIGYELLSPNGVRAPLSVDRKLSWASYYNLDFEDYCITLLDYNLDLVIRRRLLPRTYTGGREYWTIPPDVVLNSETNYYWRIDTGSKYENGFETAGSESSWATFFYENTNR